MSRGLPPWAALLSLALLACGTEGPETGSGSPADTVADTQAGGTEPTLRFVDVTRSSGLDMVTVTGREPATQIVEGTGTGLALLDYDGDGDLDVFVPNGSTLDDPDGGAGCRLFANRGDMTFEDVTGQAGLSFARWATGVAVGDVDGDGHEDIFIACFGPDVLLRNTGDGRFEDVTAQAGLGSEAYATGCAFGDVDGDGDLDLYVANYVVFDPADPPPPAVFKGQQVYRGPQSLTPVQDLLYENRGDGTFVDVTQAWGCADVAPSYGLGVAILDFDDDGRQEIFVANDGERNFLFDDDDGEQAGPDRPRRLVDRGIESGIALAGNGLERATMGIAVGDVDGNGRPDVFTTNFSSDPNTLHLNLDGRFFEDRTAIWGLAAVSRPYLGWSTMFADFDLDGDEDLFIVNGHVYPNATKRTMDSTVRQPPLLLRRTASRFEPVDAEEAGAWLNGRHNDRNAAAGDLDGDGDLDLVVAGLNGPVRLLRNESPPAGRALTVALSDRRPEAGNPRGLGSRLELDVDGVVQRRWIFSGGGYASASPPWACFAIPEDARSVTLRLRWPDGHEQTLAGIAPGQRLVVTRE